MENYLFPEILQSTIPHLTTTQMIEVDRAMVEDFQINLIQMMENAGRNLAHLARVRFLDGDPRGKSVAVLAGTGGNGGGALVCARRLQNWGGNVHVFTTKAAESFTPIPAHQLDILRQMNVTVVPAATPSANLTPTLIIDGIIGYNLRGAPRGPAADLIRWANAQPAPILSLDVPSGVDSTANIIRSPAIHATATLTLALPKVSLLQTAVRAQAGDLYLADISVPPALYAATLGMKVGNIFAASDIVRLK